MKKHVYKLLSVLCIGFLVLTGCEKDEVKTIAGEGTSGTLSGTATSVSLTRETLEDEVISFTYTGSDFGYNAGIVYSLQFAAKGADFASPREIVLENGTTTIAYTGLDFNNLLLSLNLPLEENSDVEIRLKSAISSNIAVYSNVVTVNSKPIPLTSWVYVPGGYQGWNPATADSLVSVTGNGVYTGVVVFPENELEFKITPEKSWDLNYGDAGDGVLESNGPNMKAPAGGGMMLITVNLNTNTWAMEASPVWSLIGNAIPGTNWDADRDMKFVNDGAGNWSITLALQPGAFKFRRNHDWGTNLGGADGTLSLGGADLSISEAGDYTIVMNPTALTYEIVKN